MKANYGTIDIKGGVFQRDDGNVSFACPGCGAVYTLRIPPFTFDRERVSIGPDSIKIYSCGWHGYLTDGEWITSSDSACGKLLAREGSKTMTVRGDIKVGDRVDFARMSNKSVKLRGTVEKIYEEGVPLVEVKLEGSEAIETAHLADIALVTEDEQAAAAAAAVSPDTSKGEWKTY